jgi:endonuclease-3 related protein
VGRGRAPTYRPGFRGALSERQREEVCVGAILTQNTAWTNVLRALASLRAAGVVRLADVEAVPASRLARLIRSSGYFRQKARKLRVFAAEARRRGPLGRWLAGPLPEAREQLLALWGVGPETAASMLLYAAGRPVFVIDAYTLRLGRRLGWFRGHGYAEAQRALTAALPADAAVYAELHALIVELSKRHCRAVPSCAGCPLLLTCRHGQARLRARPRS